MAISVAPITPILGAEITGIDLSKQLSNAEFEKVQKAFVTNSVLVFRNQDLTAEAMINFSRRFGPLIVHVLKEALLDDHPEIYKLSNKRKNGQR